VSLNQRVQIAIVGTGVIGASWAACYLARRLDVVATDPRPQAEANLRKNVDDAWPLMTQVGLSAGASRDWLIRQLVAEAVLGSEHMNGGNLLRRSAT
jgi:3-hydroxyacyl-CoA dehydrogenase